MPSSLRWRLQFWYAVVLTAVVAGFALILYLEVRASRFREVDADLLAASGYIDSSLRSWPRFELDGSPSPPKDSRVEQILPPREVPPRKVHPPRTDSTSIDERHSPIPPKRTGDIPPKKGGEFPPKKDDNEFPRERGEFGPKGDGGNKGDGRAPPRSREKLIADLTPPGWPGVPDSGERAYGVWRADGVAIQLVNLTERLSDEISISRPNEVAVVATGDDRLIARMGPRETVIAVRRNVATIRADLRAFAGRLLLIGALVLAVGLLGGWWSSSRIIRPIRTMARTASRISVSNLSERIETDALDTELAELAVVLNGTYKRLESAFLQLNRFTADASHELRTPLAVIRSQVELSLSRTRTAEEYRRTLETCLRTTIRMTGIVDGLLTLARADAGRLELPSEPVDLAELIDETVSMLRQLAHDRNVTLSVDAVPHVVHGDANALARLIGNLVENAIRYNRPGGRVLIRLGVSNGQVTLSVKDTGVGIPPTDRLHIFDRFYRVDVARSRETGGAGLGLAICKTIAEVHGGTILYRPRTLEGSEFRVTLPLPTTLALPARAIPGSTPPLTAGSTTSDHGDTPESIEHV